MTDAIDKLTKECITMDHELRELPELEATDEYVYTSGTRRETPNYSLVVQKRTELRCIKILYKQKLKLLELLIKTKKFSVQYKNIVDEENRHLMRLKNLQIKLNIERAQYG